MQRSPDRRRSLRPALRGVAGGLLAGACGLLLGACGSSGVQAATSGQVINAADRDQALRFSQCMRSHGVPNFPDPSAGGGVDFELRPGIDAQSPAFEAAQRACKSLLPSKAAPPTMSAREQRAALEFAQCMRAHGEPDFPDPTRTVPRTATRVLALAGMVFTPSGAIDPKDPAFRKAASTCGIRLPGAQPGSAP
jgi:hypothetical protein